MEDFLWNLYATYYDSTVLNFVAYKEMIERINTLLDVKNKSTILNIGCGTGNLEIKASKNLEKFKWIGIDQSTKMIEISKKKVQEDSRFDFILENMNNLQSFLSDKTFDSIILVNSLYVAKDPKFILSLINKSLSDKGKIIISNPKETSSIKVMLKEEWERRSFFDFTWTLLKLFPSFVINVIIRLKAGSGNYHFYSKKDLQEILESLGLTVINSEDVYSNQSILIVAQK